jgi:hypothetical protein
MLKEKYPELYIAITTHDKEVLEVINSYKGKFSVYADLRDAVLEHYNLKDKYDGHVPNQLELYWMSSNYGHKIACN